MPKEHRPPSPATVKALYANAFRCAYPSCRRPLYKVDPETGERSLNSNVAHICARSEGGERWDENMTEQENRSSSNLLILCLEHAWEIDQPNRAAAFPPELLKTWKQEQLNEFDAIGGQGWILNSEMANEALIASEHIITIADSVLGLGGAGGNSRAAGGGGGGAIGTNARGGGGGKGGDTHYYGDPIDLSLFDYKLPNAEHPGAGGGGAGSENENAVGGEGGGGGDRFVAKFSMSELESDNGPLSVKLVVGRGGASQRYPGEHAENGEDSEIHFITPDGKTVRSIIAKGGKRGSPGFALPPTAREANSTDIESGLNVCAIVIAEVIHPTNSLLNVLGGAGEFWKYPALPADVCWPTAVIFSLGYLPLGLQLTFYIVVDDPNGYEIFRLPLNVTKGTERLVANLTYSIAVQFRANIAGVWCLRILSGDFEFARLPVEIRIGDA